MQAKKTQSKNTKLKAAKFQIECEPAKSDRPKREHRGNDRPENDRAENAHAKTDRRILRTRDALGDAMMSLMHEKPFDEITVQQVLDRAGVSRATFYAHYRDKDDLFLSDVEDFLEMVSGALKRHNADPKRLLPVQEFFSHVREMGEFHATLAKSGKLNDVLALARGLFARSIEGRLQSAGLKIDPAQRAGQAHALAGSIFSLLDWWMDKGMKADPKEMDDLFHRMAWKGLTTAPQ